MEITETQGTLGETEEKEKINYKVYKIPSSPHPIASLRPFAMAEAIRQTNLTSKHDWCQLITDEITTKEFGEGREQVVKIIKARLEPFPPSEEEKAVSLAVARLSAEIAANIITTAKLSTLGGKKITEVFSWTDKDEALVEFVRQCYQEKKESAPASVSTSHIVAAAIIEASSQGADIEDLFRAMKKYLVQTQGKF